jgi:predicted TIM-barrel fold metal-dependent hydrolase
MIKKEEIIDFHAHAFPDELAPRAMKKLLEESPGVEAFLDGRISSLLESMDKNGISKSVICCIATVPEQFEPIIKWCKKAQTDPASDSAKATPDKSPKGYAVASRLVMFPSIHPADEKFKEHIVAIKAEGFKGVKMHPYYQDFRLDEERLLAIYEELIRNGLMLVVHTGFDIAFPNDDRADSRKIVKITEMFPKLKFVATHLGAWQQWDEVEQILAGKHIYMEISWSLEYLSKEQAKRIILKHPADCVLFGTDSPWTDQGKSIELLKKLELPEELEKRILNKNAKTLLGLS